MAAGLRELFERRRRRGVLLLMSDFLMDDLEDVFAALRLFRHRGWEVVVLHLVHPDEERLPEGMAYRFEGMEDEGRVDCSPAEIRAAYRERFQRPPGHGPPAGPGRRLRLPPRVDGDSVLADVGRLSGRAGKGQRVMPSGTVATFRCVPWATGSRGVGVVHPWLAAARRLVAFTG